MACSGSRATFSCFISQQCVPPEITCSSTILLAAMCSSLKARFLASSQQQSVRQAQNTRPKSGSIGRNASIPLPGGESARTGTQPVASTCSQHVRPSKDRFVVHTQETTAGSLGRIREVHNTKYGTELKEIALSPPAASNTGPRKGETKPASGLPACLVRAMRRAWGGWSPHWSGHLLFDFFVKSFQALVVLLAKPGQLGSVPAMPCRS